MRRRSRSRLSHRHRIRCLAPDVTCGKPNPEPFLQALAGLNRRQSAAPIAPDACLAIEDSRPGIQAARSAGMKVLAIANTHTLQDLHEADAISYSLGETRLEELRTRLWPT
ncbi:MAG: hypothetical protein CV081_07755 [Nitrospira sp. LK265]|nr:hypothetical protein [Nitrospira sp. LK265]